MWLTKLNGWSRRPFEKYYNQSLVRSSLFWLMTLVIGANGIATIRVARMAFPRPGVATSLLVVELLLFVLWMHLILQHRRFDGMRTDVAISTFTIVVVT